MVQRGVMCLGGVLAAVALLGQPAVAQKHNMGQAGMSVDFSVPYSVSGEEVYAVQQLANAGFTDMDIVEVLPLLEDLRSEEMAFRGRHSREVVYILNSTDMSG